MQAKTRPTSLVFLGPKAMDDLRGKAKIGKLRLIVEVQWIRPGLRDFNLSKTGPFNAGLCWRNSKGEWTAVIAAMKKLYRRLGFQTHHTPGIICYFMNQELGQKPFDGLFGM